MVNFDFGPIQHIVCREKRLNFRRFVKKVGCCVGKYYIFAVFKPDVFWVVFWMLLGVLAIFKSRMSGTIKVIEDEDWPAR